MSVLIHDSFVEGIKDCLIQLGYDVPNWQISGVLGIGTRFSLAMNVRTGKEIGHPSSNYIWDLISVAENCFAEFGIEWTLFIGSAYSGQARKTAARSSRTISSNVHLISPNTTMIIPSPVVYALPNGKWVSSTSSFELNVSDYLKMPFGPVFLHISGYHQQELKFPSSTLGYLEKTLERGEEPMESVGMGDYSCVSGWKAFARWMQSYSLPLRDIKHPHLDNLLDLLRIRRTHFVKYLTFLLDHLTDAKETELISELRTVYDEQVKYINTLHSQNTNFVAVKTLYFIEQRTLPVYKAIGIYLKERENRNLH